MSRVAGIAAAGALITAATAPAALAQTDTSAPETTTTTSEATTTTAPSTSETTTTTAPSTTATTGATTTTPSLTDSVKTEAPDPTSTTTTAASEPPKDTYQDNVGHGFVGLGGEGVLVIACAAGAPGNVATQYLSVTGGPDQDESDGRYWNYSVRVADAPAGTTTAKFSWTCAGVEGNGVVEFEQEEPPVTSTSATPSSTAPVTTATSATATPTSAAPGNSAPKAQVKVAPKGGVETGFGGTAW
ncbi:hypothetical protein GTY80_04555 [Amycolatopsis sp. SID8362]|nr:hypothetical protein [Amycolatopsis sp. SID8362]NBH02532.1 hypothetical protein [Amycolatopsis sp. SID8362]NED39236.1 hypothetical protein [Amycolatopsis sp. SID8362]